MENEKKSNDITKKMTEKVMFKFVEMKFLTHSNVKKNPAQLQKFLSQQKCQTTFP